MGIIKEEQEYSLTDEMNLDPDIKHELEDFSDDIFDMKIEIEGLIKDLEDDKKVVKRKRRKAASENEVDFLGFEGVTQDNYVQVYRDILERLEAEIKAESLTLIPLRYVMASASAIKRSRKASDISRSSSEQPPKRKCVSSVPAARHKRQSNVTIDLSSPLLRVPLERGWRRELVYRTQENSCDIYYYTPDGKKHRSKPEILQHLSGTGLTIENFTFRKQPLGINDPNKEIVRKAKVYPWVKSIKLTLKRKSRLHKARKSKLHESKTQEPKSQASASQENKSRESTSQEPKSRASSTQEQKSRASTSQELKSRASTLHVQKSRASTPQERKPIASTSREPLSRAFTSQKPVSRASTSQESRPSTSQEYRRSTSQESRPSTCRPSRASTSKNSLASTSQESKSQASTSREPKSRTPKYQKHPKPIHQKPVGRKRGRKPKNPLAAATDAKSKPTPTKLKKSFESKTKRNQSVMIDIQSPLLRIPLERGWKRELVYRSLVTSNSKSDVYYVTPTGKRVRSNREVLEHLSGTDLTLDNFSFLKHALGVNDPDREVIRCAKPISGWSCRFAKAQGRPRSTNSRSAQHKISNGVTSAEKKQRRKGGAVMSSLENDEDTVDSDVIVD